MNPTLIAEILAYFQTHKEATTSEIQRNVSAVSLSTINKYLQHLMNADKLERVPSVPERPFRYRLKEVV